MSTETNPKKKPRLTKEDKQKKKEEIIRRVRDFRHKLVNGCGNPKCGRFYCKSSEYFQYTDVTTEKEISLLAFELVKHKPPHPSCTDPPFFKILWPPEKTQALPDRVEELRRLYREPCFLDDNFLVPEEAISDEFHSINFDELEALHESMESQDEVSECFSEVLGKALARVAQEKVTTKEHLRRILILCEHPELVSMDPDNYENMTLLLNSFVNMTKDMLTTCGQWLRRYPIEKLQSFVYTLQQYITMKFMMKYDEAFEEVDPQGPSHQVMDTIDKFQHDILSEIWGCFVFLECIYQANLKFHGVKFDFWDTKPYPIPLTEFNNSAINETFGVRHVHVDLAFHFAKDNRPKRSFYTYKFLFDAGTKSKVLEVLSRRNMRAQLYQSFFALEQPFLVLKIHRNSIIQDTLQILQSHTANQLRKPLKVKFIGEQGVDEGGVKKEFFQILIRELFVEEYGMFTYRKEDDIFWFREGTLVDHQEFELIGMILGLAIYNNIILDIRFPNLIFKKLMNKPLSFEDFRDFDPALAKGFEQLLEFEGDVENTFCRFFNHDYNFFGSVQTVELKPGGSKIPVTNENRNEYVKTYVDYYMDKSIERQYGMLKSGFHTVAGPKILELFEWEELQLLICGSDNVDFEALESSAQYMDGYDEDSITVKFFWEIAHSLDIDNKRKLLSFCTGSDRIPIRGLSDLVMTISKNGDDENQLPTSHTCYNHLLLPEYKDKNVMKERLLTAIQNSEGFGLI